jgi:peroxiredoxin family protein
VTLFFTMGACRALLGADGGGNPGWHGLGNTESGATAAETDRTYGERGVATFDELLSACRDLGARFIVCEMGLRAMDLERSDLRGDIAVDLGGVVTFLADASKDGAVIFI